VINATKKCLKHAIFTSNKFISDFWLILPTAQQIFFLTKITTILNFKTAEKVLHEAENFSFLL
jgi:hypothetical protein